MALITELGVVKSLQPKRFVGTFHLWVQQLYGRCGVICYRSTCTVWERSLRKRKKLRDINSWHGVSLFTIPQRQKSTFAIPGVKIFLLQPIFSWSSILNALCWYMHPLIISSYDNYTLGNAYTSLEHTVLPSIQLYNRIYLTVQQHNQYHHSSFRELCSGLGGLGCVLLTSAKTCH